MGTRISDGSSVCDNPFCPPSLRPPDRHNVCPGSATSRGAARGLFRSIFAAPPTVTVPDPLAFARTPGAGCSAKTPGNLLPTEPRLVF